MLLALPAIAAAERIPTEPDDINPFVEEFNRYVEIRRQGLIDLRQWKRVLRAWDRMTK